MVIHVAKDEFFTRIGNDIHCQVHVTFAEAARGACIMVPTLDGYRTVQLPQGSPNRWFFRFPGAGAPATPNLPAGDQVMEIVVTTPHNLSPLPPMVHEVLAQMGAANQTGAGHE